MSKKTKQPENVIGKLGKFVVPVRSAAAVSFRVDVKIIGTREQFGRIDYEITPVAGDGTAFVSSKSVEDIEL
jgi:hypothetical protein